MYENLIWWQMNTYTTYMFVWNEEGGIKGESVHECSYFCTIICVYITHRNI